MLKGVIILAVIIIAAALIFGYGYFSRAYNYSFSVSVEYVGSWREKYNGYPGMTESAGGLSYISGTYSGSGNNSKTITLSDGGEITLCLSAAKLDNSNSRLTVAIGARSNSTSLPFGIVSVCASAVIASS